MNEWKAKDLDIYVLDKRILNDNILECQIHLSLYCNYNCPYCVNHESKDSSSINPNSITKIIDFLKLQKFNLLKLTFTGGEPTLNPYLEYYIDLFRKEFKNITIRVISNLTAPLDTYLNLKVDTYLLSYHSEFVKDTDTWFKKIKEIGLKGPINPKNISVALMYHSKNGNHIEQTYNKYKCLIAPVRTHISNIHNQKELKYYRNDDNSIIIDKINQNVRFDDHSNMILKGKYLNKDNCFNYRNFKGMLCGTGFIISQNLEVFKCWQTNRPDQAILDLNKQPPKYIRRWFLCMYNEDCCDGFEFPKYSIKYFVKHNKEIIYG
jgi:organic radical activating enzyme